MFRLKKLKSIKPPLPTRVNMSHVSMSLRDVEQVKGFIGSMAEIRNRLQSISKDGCCKSLAEAIRHDMDTAFKTLYGRIGDCTSGVSQLSDEEMRRRGWRYDKSEVEHPEREGWPSVCIIIPVFNSPELLKKCLVSLKKTDYPGNLYCLCIDNASTDIETLAILQNHEFVSLGMRFEDPVGFAVAVNAGMKSFVIENNEPIADYYVLFNQDCVVTQEDWLTQLINWMEQRPKCGICGSKLLYPDGTIQEAGIEIPKGTTGRHRFAHMDSDSAFTNYYERVQAVTGAVYCIRAEMAREIGLLDEGYQFSCEDMAYCLQASKRGWEVWYVPDSVVIHHDCGVRKDNATSPRLAKWIEASEEKFHRDWGALPDDYWENWK